jgi:hypothetical protein
MNATSGATEKIATKPRSTSGWRATAKNDGRPTCVVPVSIAMSICAITAGRRVAQSHIGIHASPTSAVKRNATRQPYQPYSALASGGTSMAPIDDPENRKPKPRARSSGGSTRCTVCAEPGNAGPSVRPSKMRSANSAPKPGTSACIAATVDHASTAQTRPRRAPTRSISQPESGVAIR